MTWLLVACGGAIGASLRYGAGFIIAKPHSIFPWATWSINILGCFLAGVFFAFTQKYPTLQNETRLFLMVGILGGFTTFSAFSLDVLKLVERSEVLAAISYVGLSVLLSLFAVFAGLALVKALS